MACTDLHEWEGSPASATFSQAPGEQDATPAVLPSPFSLLEESELRERRWYAQEPQVQFLISLLPLHLLPSQETALGLSI